MKKLLVLGLMLVTLAACGGGEKVGEAFEEFEGNEAGERIGGLESTPSPKPAAKPQQTQAAPASQPTPAAPAQPKQTAPPQQAAPPASTVDVKITSGGFDPTALRVTHGATIKVTNTDSQAHTYTAVAGDSVVYDTGSLAAGQSKSFVANTAGKFQVEDRSRPWIIGSLEVVAG